MFFFAYFPWWSNGPYSPGLGSCAGVILIDVKVRWDSGLYAAACGLRLGCTEDAFLPVHFWPLGGPLGIFKISLMTVLGLPAIWGSDGV